MIPHSIVASDASMMCVHYSDLRPFDTLDDIGFTESVERMEKEGVALPDSIKKMKAAGAKSAM